MSNKICPKCGTSNPPDMRFCSNCGQALSSPIENTTRRTEEPPPTVFMNQPQTNRVQPPPVNLNQPAQPPPQNASNPPQPPKKGSKTWMFGVAGCLGLLVISVVGLVIIGLVLGYSGSILSDKKDTNDSYPSPNPTSKSNSNSVFNTSPLNSKKTDQTDDDATDNNDSSTDSDSGAFLVKILETRKQVGSFNQTSAKSLDTKKYFPRANGAAQAEYSDGSKYVYLTVGKFDSLAVAKQNFDDQIAGVKSGGGKVTYENTASDGTISAIYNNNGYYFAEYCNTNGFCNRLHSDNQAALKNFFQEYAK